MIFAYPFQISFDDVYAMQIYNALHNICQLSERPVNDCPYRWGIVNMSQKGANSRVLRGSWPERAVGVLTVPLKGY